MLWNTTITLILIDNFHNSGDKIDEDGKLKRGKIWFEENEIVIGLAQIKNDDWLLIDISKITKSFNKSWDDKTPATLNTFYEKDLTLPPIKNKTWKQLVAFFNAHGL